MAGFESACQVNSAGERVDLIAGVLHDVHAREDYKLLHTVNIRCARDGVRWHLIDKGGSYDFSSFLPLLLASIEAEVQVAWNLCHYGWPDGLDVFSGEFVDRFALYARATAKVVREHTDTVPFFTPVNEISFFSWAGSRRIMYPYAEGRDDELKQQLVRASVAACDAIWDVDPRARFLYPEPVIHVFPPADRPDLIEPSAQYTESQYEVWDMIAGRKQPSLGGGERYLDILGLNYYHSNQWEHSGSRLRWEDEPRDPRWVPFREMVAANWKRYKKPLVISETSHFGAGRSRWIREMSREVYEARLQGVPVEGICLYPILDRYDWENKSHWHNSGLWDMEPADPTLRRVINAEYATALHESQLLLASIGCA
jgi:hypothetical protein